MKLFNWKCDDCKERKPDVAWTICPYADEIEEEKISVCLCEECLFERADHV